jgi:hypothetical protein
MPKRGPNKRVTYLVDYFDYNLFGIKLVNALMFDTTQHYSSIGQLLPVRPTRASQPSVPRDRTTAQFS